MSLFRKGFVILLLVVVVVGALGVLFGADALFARALRSGGAAALGAPVEFTDAELSLFGGSAAVSEFRGGTEEHPLLGFQQAAFDVGVGAALGGRAHIEQATIDGLRIHLVVDEDGKLSWDPGPPPEETPKETDAPEANPDAKPAPPPEERDLVQIVQEYWVRYESYKGYYDDYGGFFGGGGGSGDEEDPASERVRWPGKPDAVATAQREAEAKGVFWLDQAAIEDFAWQTLDARTGEPLLPALASCSLRMLAIGTPPDGSTPTAEWSGEAVLEAGGELVFGYFGSRDGTPDRLTLAATSLPVRELMPLAGTSFPFDLTEGALSIATENLAFAADHLSGSLRLELADAKMLARADSPDVLGVDAKEFCNLMNAALGQQPVVFLISLGGTPAAPKFKIENENDLGDMLGGALKAEVERRANELIDEATEQLQEEAAGLLEGLIDEKIGGEVGEKLEEEVGNRLGNLIGGGRKGGG